MSYFVEQVYNGLGNASIYCLVALGITIIYGLTKLVNFAQGELLTLGAFLAYIFTAQLKWPFWVAAAVATLCTSAGGEILDRIVFRRTINRPLNGFIASLGLITAIEAVYAVGFGTDFYQLHPPTSDVWNVAGLHIDSPRVVVIGITAAACALLFLLLHRSPVGRSLRAISEDRLASESLGVRVGQNVSVAFLIGSALAGIGGALFGTLFPFSAFSGSEFLIQGFAVAILGGLGNVPGAIAAALLFAIPESLGAGYVSVAWSPAFGLLVVVAVLLVRPGGLFRGSDAGASQGFHADWTPPSRNLRMTPRDYIPFSVLILLLAASMPFIAPSAGDLSTSTSALIVALMALALWVPLHFGGLFSVVQACLMGVGAYTAALIVNHVVANLWLSLACGMTAGAVTAALIAVVSFRTKGSAFLILTFALASLLDTAFGNASNITGGILGTVLEGDAGHVGDINLQSARPFYFLCWTFVLVVITVATAIAFLGFGHRLRAIRDNEMLSSALGLNAYWHKLGIFVIGGAIAGIAGCLSVYQTHFADPTQFTTAIAIRGCLVVILGGIEAPAGPLVAAFLVSFIPEIFNLGPEPTQVLYGALLVALILVAPSGAVPLLGQGWRRLRPVASARSLDATP
jgi:branched-chain amino acid transport system permease protein